MNCIVCGKEIPVHRLKQGKKTCSGKCQIRTPEARQKKSQKMKELFSTEAGKQLKSNAMKKAYQNPEYLQKRSETSKQLWKNNAFRQKTTKSIKMAWSNEELKKQQSNIIKSVMTEENKQKISEGTKKGLSTATARQNLSKAQKEVQNRPEVKLRKSESTKRLWQSEQFRQKRITTMKLRGTVNSSYPELRYKSMLESLFNKVHYQYKCNRYPFSCDFYIEDIDTFIELHFHWTHGGMPYDANDNKCQELLDFWKSKSNHNYYTKAIMTWTKGDVEKLNIAKQNKLNYLCFYNNNQIDAWLKQFDIKEIA